MNYGVQGWSVNDHQDSVISKIKTWYTICPERILSWGQQNQTYKMSDRTKKSKRGNKPFQMTVESQGGEPVSPFI